MSGAAVERSELLVPGPAEALAGLLGCEPPDADGGPLPLLWHTVYLLDRPRLADLGPDGHPRIGVVPVPPAEGMRRMFAGGRVRLLSPLRLGRPASRRSVVASTEVKQGRTGPLAFVTVRHVVEQDGRTCVHDEQDLVYRPAGSPPGPPPRSSEAAPLLSHERDVPVDPVLLFRFSALTYNGHRIHYDRDYARDVEGWGGLVVHGPWQALVMAEAARRLADPQGDGVQQLAYRLEAPLLDGDGMVVSAVPDGLGAVADGARRPVHCAVRDRSGRRTASATWTGPA